MNEFGPYVLSPNAAYNAESFFGVNSIDTAVGQARPASASGIADQIASVQAHPLALLAFVAVAVVLYAVWHEKG